MDNPIETLSKRLNIDINDHETLFITALSHPSITKDKAQAKAFERLEFLGDAILSMIVAEWLYQKFPNHSEGNLTQMRAMVVNKKNISKLVQRLNLTDVIYQNETIDAIHSYSDRILTDIFEALIATIYFTLGYKKTLIWLHDILEQHIDYTQLPHHKENFKGLLQEYAHIHKLGTIEYHTDTASGKDNNKIFTISVWIDDKCYGRGNGTTKKDAQQTAAKKALEILIRDDT